MALKAGYQGVKKSLLDKLLQMSGSLIIKSLGTALSLSDAGELTINLASDTAPGIVQPDGVTTFIEEGLLKSAASGFSVTPLATYPNGMPRNEENLIEGMSDYDAIIISTWQASDGGYSEGRRCYMLLYKAFEGVTQVCYYYYQRNISATVDFTDSTIQYSSSASNEAAGYQPIIYEVYGVNF